MNYSKDNSEFALSVVNYLRTTGKPLPWTMTISVERSEASSAAIATIELSDDTGTETYSVELRTM